MSYSFLHLSDLHFQVDWEERLGDLLQSFRSDVEKQAYPTTNSFLIFSGDIVKAGSDHLAYDKFFEDYNSFFNDLGFTYDKRVIIPGNHDVDRSFVAGKQNLLTGIVNNDLDTSDFNDALRTEYTDLIGGKFSHYKDFEKSFAKYGAFDEEGSYWGRGHSLSDNVGVYCLNTALLSFAGHNSFDDSGFLTFESRDMYKWLQENKSEFKVLVMHHSLEWLSDPYRKELEKIIEQNFSLVLYGHDHDMKNIQVTQQNGSVVYNRAPALFTNEPNVELAYTRIDLDLSENEIKFIYRSRSKAGNFVSASSLTGTDNGINVFELNDLSKDKECGLRKNFSKDNSYNSTLDLLNSSFQQELTELNSNSMWVSPTLSSLPETSNDHDNAILCSAEEILKDAKNIDIVSPQEFGATTLSKFLVLKSWEQNKRFCVYIDMKFDGQTLNDKSLKKFTLAYCKKYQMDAENISYFCLDNFDIQDKKHRKVQRYIQADYNNVDFIRVSHSYSDELRESSENVSTLYFLWSLERSQVRSLVEQYLVGSRQIDINNMLSSVLTTLENLNLPRSPYNCFSLMKIYESNHEGSPVNRTDMLEKLFSVAYINANIPSNFGSLPDQKDGLYALGYFSASLFYRENYLFTKAEFQQSLKKYCDEKLMEFDIDVLFWLLVQQKIISKTRGEEYYFRFSCWPKFFAAYHMHLDAEAFDFFAGERRYAKYPEIAEYYTGLTRQANDFIQTVHDDLTNAIELFETNTGIGDHIQIYESLKWSATPEAIEAIEEKLQEDINGTSIPDNVKDQIAEKNYDRAKPHRQDVQGYLDGASLYDVMQISISASRVLRNSHHAPAELKKKLLKKILKAWNRVIQTAVIFAPVIAKEGNVVFQRVDFTITGDLQKKSVKDKMDAILLGAPLAASRLFSEDLASFKNTPLYVDFLKNTDNELQKFLVASQVLRNKPNSWQKIVSEYAMSLPKNSYFLNALFNQARSDYKFGFNGSVHQKELQEFMGLSLARHKTGAKKINSQTLERAKEAASK